MWHSGSQIRLYRWKDIHSGLERGECPGSQQEIRTDSFTAFEIETNHKEEQIYENANGITYIHSQQAGVDWCSKPDRVFSADRGCVLLGFIAGGALFALVLSTPSELPLFTFHASSGILLAIEQYSRTIATIVLSLIMGLGIISIVGNVLDIVQMRVQLGTVSKRFLDNNGWL